MSLDDSAPVHSQHSSILVRPLTLDPRGTININAVPWAEVYIDGEKAGETPLANVPIRLGVREIVFRNPKFPDRKQTVTVTTSQPYLSLSHGTQKEVSSPPLYASTMGLPCCIYEIPFRFLQTLFDPDQLIAVPNRDKNRVIAGDAADDLPVGQHVVTVRAAACGHT